MKNQAMMKLQLCLEDPQLLKIFPFLGKNVSYVSIQHINIGLLIELAIPDFS